MKVIKNRDILQSYIITTAKYDFSIYEKRILYCQIMIEQELLKDNKIHPQVKIDVNLWKDKKYTIPVHWLLPNGEKDKNHSQVKKAFNALMKKTIIYEDERYVTGFPLVQSFKIDKKGETVTWQSYSEVVAATVNFAKGFRKYELKTAMDFNSTYTMRFYELLSGQQTPLTFTIDQLKEMFKIQNKYTYVKDFIKYVINSSQKELNKKSPFSFEYKINKQGRKYHSITFYPKQIPQNRDPELEKAYLQKRISPHWSLSTDVIRYLKETFSFETKEIQQHIDLFVDANLHFDLIDFLSMKKRYILEAKNPKGYLISCVKKELEVKVHKNTESQNLLSDLAHKMRVR